MYIVLSLYPLGYSSVYIVLIRIPVLEKLAHLCNLKRTLSVDMHMTTILKTAPKDGYILPLWEQKWAYRATALAYCQRETMNIVANVDGNQYTKEEIENAIIK